MTGDERPVGRPSDGALWASVTETVRQAILPALDDDPHTRQVAIHLVGLTTYAERRGPDPTPARIDELAELLDAAARDGDPLASGRWTAGAPRTPADVLAAAGAVLSAAAETDAAETDAAETDAAETDAADAANAVRNELRAVLVRHLDEDLAIEHVLLGAFRGRLPDG